jgi:thiamine-monophosphate kinase
LFIPSEFEFIKGIRDRAARNNPSGLIRSIGDDAAVLGEIEGRETLVTVDLLVEDVDFKLEYAVPRWLGHKSLAVSLSDIAAMGGAPRFSLLTLAIPRHQGQPQNASALDFHSFWEEFFAGYFALADDHDLSLVGGDISSTPHGLAIDSMVIGHCGMGRSVRRSGARIGDGIYLTGVVGASAAGLRLLLQGARVDEAVDSLEQRALRAHLKPEPRVEFGRLMGDLGLANSMIDLSDGLAQDLAHICEESGVGAVIDFDSVPVAGEVSLVIVEPESAFEFAVAGGEDFELLLTAGAEREAELFDAAAQRDIKLARIGEIIPPEQSSPLSPILLRREGETTPLSTRGFDHLLPPPV